MPADEWWWPCLGKRATAGIGSFSAHHSFLSKGNRVAPAGAGKRDQGERQAKLAFACRPRRPLQMRIAAHLGRHRSITLRATRPRLSEAGNGRMGRWRLSAIGCITSIAAPKPEGAKL